MFNFAARFRNLIVSATVLQTASDRNKADKFISNTLAISAVSFTLHGMGDKLVSQF